MVNCKIGDLAIVVGIDAGKATNCEPNDYGIKDFKMVAVDLRGLIVKCVKPYFDDGECGWEIEPQEVRYCGVMNDGRSVSATGTLTTVPDRILRPLRGGDLGEDVFSTNKLPSEKYCKEATW